MCSIGCICLNRDNFCFFVRPPPPHSPLYPRQSLSGLEGGGGLIAWQTDAAGVHSGSWSHSSKMPDVDPVRGTERRRVRARPAAPPAPAPCRLLTVNTSSSPPLFIQTPCFCSPCEFSLALFHFFLIASKSSDYGGPVAPTVPVSPHCTYTSA